MLAKILAFITLVAIAAIVTGTIFGYAIMIAVGVLHATYGFGTLSFASSWALGLCWSVLFSASAVAGK